jgi:hypothetical protein
MSDSSISAPAFSKGVMEEPEKVISEEKVEIPVMEKPKEPEIVKQPEMTEEQKREAHLMFHELLKTQSDPLLQHIADLTNQVNELTKKIK